MFGIELRSTLTILPRFLDQNQELVTWYMSLFDLYALPPMLGQLLL
jgi:hypothetical protein